MSRVGGAAGRAIVLSVLCGACARAHGPIESGQPPWATPGSANTGSAGIAPGGAPAKAAATPATPGRADTSILPSEPDTSRAVPTASGGVTVSRFTGEDDPGCTLPWYRCPGTCSATHSLQGAGVRDRKCAPLSFCNYALELNTGAALDGGDCERLSGRLTLGDGHGETRTIDLALSDTAWEQAVKLALDVSGIEVDTSCDDCSPRDAWITVRDAREESVKIPYAYLLPPAPLRELDDFMRALILQASTCHGPLLESCAMNDVLRTLATPICGPIPVVGSACECPYVGAGDLECDGACGACSWDGNPCSYQCQRDCTTGAMHWKEVCATP